MPLFSRRFPPEDANRNGQRRGPRRRSPRLLQLLPFILLSFVLPAFSSPGEINLKVFFFFFNSTSRRADTGALSVQLPLSVAGPEMNQWFQNQKISFLFLQVPPDAAAAAYLLQQLVRR